jgi:NAD(P)-dependent dehydrogenase (short-subunit alcohol dehydrogenase family)
MINNSKTIVITGSTRGIGFGLADSFLKLGCNVVICGRRRESVEKAVDRLAKKHNPDTLAGYPCDVTVYDTVQSVWDAAKKQFGMIDIWINNAGIGHNQQNIWEIDQERIRQVIETNLLGALYGAKVAVAGMLAQQHGALYTMEGMGSDGMILAGVSIYGTSKYGLKYMTDALVKETKGTNLVIGAIRPGMTATELITNQYKDKPEQWKKVVKIFNTIADKVETITPWIAKKVLANKRTGARITWFTRRKALARFSMMAFSNRKIFDDAPRRMPD